MLRKRFLAGALALTLGGLSVAATQPWTLFQDMPMPTEHHKALLKGVGEWEGHLTMYNMGPEPMKAECSESVTALGGFWTMASFKCSFMGMPFEGFASTGYDPKQGKFVGTWVDSMNPALTVMEGTMGEDGTLTMTYEGPNMMGENVPKVLTTKHDGDTVRSAFYDIEGDERKLVMTIDMTRQAAKAPAEAGAKRR